MTRTVSDAEIMMNVITRSDARDGYAGPTYPSGAAQPLESLSGWRIAYSRNFGYVSVNPDIAKSVDVAVEQMRTLGADVVEVDPGFSDPIDIFETLWFAGAARIMRDLTPEQQGQLDTGFREIGELGKSVTLQQYLVAGEQRYELTALMAAFHERFDLLVTPTMPIAPFEAGKNAPANSSYTKWTDWTQFSYPFNLTQQPAASLPCGLDSQGLPVGLQLVGRRYCDRAVLSVAKLLEAHLGSTALPQGKLLPSSLIVTHHPGSE
jgi:aspartyl-tRNA(Asn)/glutamyl-tRNA(Gln) amidotransferase subunit A